MKLFLIAGEESGDIHGSNMVRKLGELTDLSLFGTGGHRLKELGQEQYFNADEMTIIGFDGIIKNIPLIFKMFKTLKKKVEEVKPDMIVLVDYPGFNLRFAEKIKQFNIPIVYFISPQVWAWNYKRVHKIRRLINKVLCILPFEEEIFLKENIDVKYVGNPIVDHAKPVYEDKAEFYSKIKLNNKKKVIGILPGSRKKEVQSLMPEIVKAYDKLKGHYHFILGKAESITDEFLNSFIKDTDILVVENMSYDVMAHSDLLWTCSGTATLETAYLRKPMIILYSVGRFTEIVGRILIKSKFVGLPNIISGKKIIPELLQDEMNAKNIIDATGWIFEHYTEVLTQIINVSEQFSDKNPSELAAKEIFSLVSKCKYDGERTN